MSENIYDNEVAPLLKKALDICNANNMSMVCVVEFALNEIGQNFVLTGNQGIETTMTYLAAKAKGNADLLLLNLAKYARENGHNSFMLKKLGA